MNDDIVARLRDIEGGYGFRGICREAADEIERLRDVHSLACGDRDDYRRRFIKSVALSVWKPGTRWRTYINPSRSDGLFVATVADIVDARRAIPDGCISVGHQLPHLDAEELVKTLNEWTDIDAANEGFR